MAYATTNPFTGETVKTFPNATEHDVDVALDQAQQAFERWRDTPIEARAQVLQRTADLLRERRHDYASTLTLEMGKLIGEAEAEVDLSADIFEYFARHGQALLAPQAIAPVGYGDTDVKIVNDPLGILYAVEPWNFPYYQVARVAAPQLIAGNVFLLKHASIVPQSAQRIVDLLGEAGAPEGTATNLYAPHALSEQILADPRVRGVALTGSEGAGASIAALAGKYLKKSTLELGGSDAFIVLDDADVDKAADWAVVGRHFNAGQVCTASKRLIVVDAVYDRFLERYREGTANLRAGDPSDPKTTLAPLSSNAAVDTLAEQVEGAVADGATLERVGDAVPERGFFAQPAILTGIEPGSKASQTEFFGPVAQVYRVADADEAVRLANDSPYGLGGSIFSRDIHRAQALARRIDTGMVYINQPTGVKPDIPFGGVKHSGYGRELTDLGLHEFVNRKIVAVSDIDGTF